MSKDSSKDQKDKRGRNPLGITTGNPRTTLKAAAASVAGAKKVVFSEEQKALQKSSFNSGADVQRLKEQLPDVWQRGDAEIPDEPDGMAFDGSEPAPEVVSRDLWKAIRPPVESREGRRSAELYQLVLNQFAVGNNPRYGAEGPDKLRSHIFVWDVTRAMGCEIPHMLGARELTLSQTMDWLRYESSDRGWVKLSPDRAIAVAQEGRVVVAIPRDRKASAQLMALVRPEEPGEDGAPRVAFAGNTCSNDASAKEAFQLATLEYFSHQ
jgi:hypothetical protein